MSTVSLKELRAVVAVWKSRLAETIHHELPAACEGKTSPEGYEAGLGQCITEIERVIGPVPGGECRRCGKGLARDKEPQA